MDKLLAPEEKPARNSNWMKFLWLKVNQFMFLKRS